ncbi:MAG TPA: T9SS type A sorting domain-containing protein, partial [Bacteroidales bacterium]|nr:T9SS type A sorting domain-containing protein [Bacteroidales bacterium]
GNPVNLQAQATAPLTWYTAGNPTPLTGTLVYPNTSIAYVAKAQTACGTVYDTVNIQVETTPYLDAVSDTSICNGNSVHLQASGFGLIQWYQAADTVPLSNLTVAPTTSTSYIVTASNADCPLASESMQIVVNYIPGDAGIISGDSTICKGQNAVEYLIPSVDYATSYFWSLPMGTNGTSSTNNILVDFSASAVSGTISVAGTNDCGQGQTSSLQINIYDVPPTPVITINGNILHSSAPAGNQWYIQGLQIMDGNVQDYQASTDGDYYVIVTLNGCSSEHSNVITTNFAGIQTVTDDMGLFVFPNPVKAEMIIEMKGNDDDIDFEIFNSLGEIIFKGVLQGKTAIQTGSFAQGIYLLRLKTGQELKFIKTTKD